MRCITVVASVLCISAVLTATAAARDAGGASQSPSAPTVTLDGSPGVPVATPATHSLYVPVQCTDSSCTQASHVVDVVNTQTCSTQAATNCTVVARARAGTSPLDAVVDPKTDTVYAINGGGTITVIDGVHCNAVVAVGCATPIATIALGQFVVAGAIDPVTHTLYVASPAGYVFVVDISHCTVKDATGCDEPVTTLADKGDPDGIDVDVATDTVYAANDGASGNGHTLSVIDGETCNASATAGCGTVAAALVGPGPYWVTVDQATDTVYTANFNDGTISVLDGTTCDASVQTGCGTVAPAVLSGAGTGFVGIDSADHTLFGLNADDDTLSALDTEACTGATPSGCPSRAPAAQALPNQGAGYEGFPNAFASVEKTDSLYLVTQGGSNILTVVGTHDCDAQTTAGCRNDASSAQVSDDAMAFDASTHTIYMSDYARPAIDVFDANSCRPGGMSACAAIAQIPVARTNETVGALDHTTHTLYTSSVSAVQVLDLTHCNAADTTGCPGAAVGSIDVGRFPGATAVNPRTHTLYALYGLPSIESAGHVAVVDTTTCDAEDTSGCGNPPAAAVTVGAALSLAASKATDTVYVSDAGPSFSGDTLSVFDGATCNSQDTSGCGDAPATVTVGRGPDDIAVSAATHTVYVTDNGDGDVPGAVSVIDAATCSAGDPAGCAPIATIAVGRSPRGLAVDRAGQHLYVADGSSAGVSEVDVTACNAVTQTGCGAPSPMQAVQSVPVDVAVDSASHEVLELSRYTTGSLSVFPTAGA